MTKPHADLRPYGKAVEDALTALISAAHDNGDRAESEAVKLTAIAVKKVMVEAMNSYTPLSVEQPVQLAQAEAEPLLPGLDEVPRQQMQQAGPVRMGFNDTPVDPARSNLKPEPRLPRVDPAWAPNPKPAKPTGWGSGGLEPGADRNGTVF